MPADEQSTKRKRHPSDLFCWLGGAYLDVLDKVPAERSVFAVNGLAVITIPSVAAFGMAIRVKSMTATESWAVLAASAGLTFLLIIVAEIAIVRTTKNPLRLANLPAEVKSYLIEDLGMPTVADAPLDRGRGFRRWLRRSALDILRVIIAIAIGIVTSHALLEYLYADDIQNLKEQQLASELAGEIAILNDGLDAVLPDGRLAASVLPTFVVSDDGGPGAPTAANTGFLESYGDWILPQNRPANLTGEVAWLLTNDSLTVPLDGEGSLQARRSSLEAQIDEKSDELAGLEAIAVPIREELLREITGDNGRPASCSVVCNDIKDVLNPIESEIDQLKSGKADLESDLAEVDESLGAEPLPSSEQLESNLANVEGAWAEYDNQRSTLETEYEFREEDLGIGERSRLFADAVFDSPFSALVGVALAVALLGLDLTPYGLKRLFPRAHDALVELQNARVVGQQADTFKSQLGGFGERMEQIVATRRRIQAALSEPDAEPGGQGDPPPTVADPPAPSVAVPTGFERILVDGKPWLVDRSHPIQERPGGVANVYPAWETFGELNLAEPSHVYKEPATPDRVGSLRNEIDAYENAVGTDPHFPRVKAVDRRRGLLVLEYGPRRSLDHALFGLTAVGSDGTRESLHDVSAEAVWAWLSHLIDDLSVLWRQGLAFVDGHPSNSLVQGPTGGPLFIDSPRTAGIQNRGFLKLLDPGSAAEIGERSRPMGRPAYLPPEYDGLVPITIEADVHAVLGGVGYFMLTGADPVRDEFGRPVDPRQLNPHAPEALSQFVLQCLASDPSRRVVLLDDANGLEDTAEWKTNSLRFSLQKVLQDMDSRGESNQLVLRAGHAPRNSQGQP